MFDELVNEVFQDRSGCERYIAFATNKSTRLTRNQVPGFGVSPLPVVTA